MFPPANFLASHNKSEKQCPHYLSGKCSYVRKGVVCGFLHEEQVAPETIECMKRINPNTGKCIHFGSCLYFHPDKSVPEGPKSPTKTTPDKGAPPGAKRRMVPRDAAEAPPAAASSSMVLENAGDLC